MTKLGLTCVAALFLGISAGRLLTGLGVASQKPLTVHWEEVKVGKKPPGRIPAASVACSGKLFAFGGETDVKSNDPMVVNRYLNDLWMFSPSSGKGSWTRLSADGRGDSPAARVSSSMVCAAGTLTIFGGLKKLGDDFVKLADVWSFDVQRKKWTEIQKDSSAAGGPGPLCSHTAVLTDLDQDSMVVFGGNNADSANVNELWIFSLSSRQWTLKHQHLSPGARDFHTAVAIPNSATFKMWGGIEDPYVWMYDVKASAWSVAGSAPPYMSGRMGAILDDQLYSFGGLKIVPGGDTAYTNKMSLQAAGGDSWQVVNPDGSVYTRPVGRCYAAVVVMDGAIWIYGGFRRPASVERLADLWRMTPIANSTVA